ncbi:MAG: ABC transporter permease [Bacteroidetes bacterium]|jgi:lipoprotein-releasing system permease protein|nr:ABC transporter permease [Bacteroidota bacterium]MBK7569544.1 ABC transporter permease [Bacteroidota bacterium]
MWFEFFVTKRILHNKERSFSRLIIGIARVAIALSLTVMIISTSLVNGFRSTISDKVYGFWGHVNIAKESLRNSFDDEPIPRNQEFVDEVQKIPGVTGTQVYARKAAIIRTKTDIEGIILKGIGGDFDWEQFDKFMLDGKGITLTDSLVSRGMVISRSTADRLNFVIGDSVLIHIIDQKENGDYEQMYRRLKIEGIYNTGLEEFDKLFVLVDIRHIQRLNNWQADQIGGYEVFVDDPDNIAEIEKLVDKKADPFWDVQTIQQIIPSVFDWLNLQKVNEWIILTLMVLVALINMVTSLLILILERTNMIGVLKALGSNNASIRKIFLLNASNIILRGMLWGNIVGLGLCILQQQFGFIKLPEESYYVSTAPVEINILWVLAINAGTFFISVLFLIIPSLIVAKILPIKAIRFN